MTLQTLKFITPVVYRVSERDENFYQETSFKSTWICLTKRVKLRQRINCVFFFCFYNLFYVVKERESVHVLPCPPVLAPVSVAALFRCHTQPTQAQSSLQLLALAPLFLGYCTAAETADKTHHSRHQCHFLQQVILPLSSTVRWQPFKPNLISNSVKRTLAYVLCLNYKVVSYTTMRQCFLF